MPENVTFVKGSYANYEAQFITGGGTPTPGCLYYLTEVDQNDQVVATHIYLDGEEYGTAGSGSTRWQPIST